MSFCVIWLLAGCVASTDTYPALLPTDELLAEPSLPDAQLDDAATTAETRSRADALQTRAEALRGPVIEPERRRQMEDAAVAENG